MQVLRLPHPAILNLEVLIYQHVKKGMDKTKAPGNGDPFLQQRMAQGRSPAALAATVPGARRYLAGLDRRPGLGRLPVDPVPAGPFHLGQGKASVPGAPIPSRLVLQTRGHRL